MDFDVIIFLPGRERNGMGINKNPALTTEENFSMFAALLRCIKGDKKKEIVTRVNNLLYEEINKYVVFQLLQSFPTYMKKESYRNDMINSVWEEICNNFHKYNGLYKLTTFSRFYILAGAKKYTAFLNKNMKYSLNEGIYNDPINNFVHEYNEQYLYDKLSTLGLNNYESRILLMFSGIITGYKGTRYTLNMICVDPETIFLAKTVGLSDSICENEFSYKEYNNSLNKYIKTSKVIEHLRPEQLKNHYLKIKRRLKKLLKY